jgi:hypothetical protein
MAIVKRRVRYCIIDDVLGGAGIVATTARANAGSSHAVISG